MGALYARPPSRSAGVSQATLQRLAKTGILDRVARSVRRHADEEPPPPDHLEQLRAAAETPARPGGSGVGADTGAGVRILISAARRWRS